MEKSLINKNMKITTVTMTGADDSINPQELVEVSKKFPFVEWGILMSKNSQGFTRFPSKSWLDELYYVGQELKLSCHLCGTYVRQILMGSDEWLNNIGNIRKLFKRVQINTHGIKHDYDLSGLRKFITEHSNIEFIFQYDEINSEIINSVTDLKNVSTLFDMSHGAGILPSAWPKPIDGLKCGFAGGLSPENVISQINSIAKNNSGYETWIDAETHVRSDNDRKFDLVKVELFLSNSLSTGLIK